MPFKRDVSDELSQQRIADHWREILDYARAHTQVQTGRWCKAQGFTIRREILFPWLRDQPEYQVTINRKRAHKPTQKMPPGDWASFESRPIPTGYGFAGADLALVPTMQLESARWPVRRMEDFKAVEIEAILVKLTGKGTP